MTAPSLTVDGLVRYFGGLKATDEVTLQVRPGELHAIIGPNGAGKTTLINLLTGELASDGGRILIGDVDVTGQPIQQRVQLGLLRSYQITSVFDSFTVRENICLAARRKRGVRMAVWKPLVRDSETMEVARRIMAECQLQHVADEAAANLAYGQRRQLEIAMALAADPRLLLLDEPMAGMGPGESLQLVELITRLRGSTTILLIEHDMEAVFQLAERISVLVFGRIIASGDAEEIRRNPEVKKAYLGDEAAA